MNKQQLFQSLKEAGEMQDHPLLEDFKKVGFVTEAYPSLAPYAEFLADHFYDYYVFENSDGVRIMLEHTSNNACRFIGEGTEEAVSERVKSLAH